eukprot:TRINITY_DN0_c0_g4_i1.p1 TRINITY_DN0_c0_g4~~TRINITY_DN0_c0_g4_i1.p1  ORF type:complete len:750 (-),score=154.03 TRINITY_DN0_c0_g4_i1:304-2553(-)
MNPVTIKSMAVALVMAMVIATASAQPAGPRVVYGQDDRLDEYQVTDQQVKAIGQSTVVLMKKTELQRNGNMYTLASSVVLEDNGICANQRFSQQVTPGFCSGTLISPNQIATAGHCIRSQSDCDELVFVFGFVQTSQSSVAASYEEWKVFSCSSFKSILANEIDFAVVELDRPVTNFAPVAVNPIDARIGDSVLVIGHPSGLPRKYAAGSSIFRDSTDPAHKYFFEADLDTFGGNSGSGVFSAANREMIGILVRGARDYVYDASQNCQIVNVCPTIYSRPDCGGESVTYAHTIRPFVPKTCSSSADCSGQGECMSGTCSCEPGFFGSDCSFQANDQICSGNGRMVGLWECDCFSGFNGDLCEEGAPEALYPFILEPLTEGPSNFFGFSVSFDGDRIAVSQPQCDEGAPCDGGRVKVFYIGEEGPEHRATVARIGERGNKFCGYAVVLRGDRMLVTCIGVNLAGQYTNVVYLLKDEGTRWTRVARLLPQEGPMGAVGASFGISLAVDNKVIAVGAPFAQTANGKTGTVYVYEARGLNWHTRPIKIVPGDGTNDLAFGIRVATNNRRVAVSTAAQNEGSSVYLYDLQSGAITFLSKIATTGSDGYPAPMALTPSHLIVGHYMENGTSMYEGNVKVYGIVATGTMLHQTITHPTPAMGRGFGFNVAERDGFLAVIDSRSYMMPMGSSGLTVFVWNQSNGMYEYFNSGSNDAIPGVQGFGHSLDVTEDAVLVGAPFSEWASVENRGLAIAYPF